MCHERERARESSRSRLCLKAVRLSHARVILELRNVCDNILMPEYDHLHVIVDLRESFSWFLADHG